MRITHHRDDKWSTADLIARLEEAGVPTLGPATRYTGFDITSGWKAPPVLGEHTDEVIAEWLAD